MTKEQIVEWAEELEEELMFMDGYDDCISGLAFNFGHGHSVAYSVDAILQKLMKDGMTMEEADEFFSFNMEGAYVGPKTPTFIH